MVKRNNMIKDMLYIWDNHRWELFCVISIFILIFCWFNKGDDKYNPINIKYVKPTSKKKPKKYETECRRILEDIFNIPFNTVRPSFLKNPTTGKNLELDMYNPNLNLAVEYQGAQHRIYTPFFHKDYTDFLNQLERDKFKKDKCRELGIDLICVPDTIKYEDLGTYIKNELYKINKLK